MCFCQTICLRRQLSCVAKEVIPDCGMDAGLMALRYLKSAGKVSLSLVSGWAHRVVRYIWYDSEVTSGNIPPLATLTAEFEGVRDASQQLRLPH